MRNTGLLGGVIALLLLLAACAPTGDAAASRPLRGPYVAGSTGGGF